MKQTRFKNVTLIPIIFHLIIVFFPVFYLQQHLLNCCIWVDGKPVNPPPVYRYLNILGIFTDGSFNFEVFVILILSIILFIVFLINLYKELTRKKSRYFPIIYISILSLALALSLPRLIAPFWWIELIVLITYLILLYTTKRLKRPGVRVS